MDTRIHKEKPEEELCAVASVVIVGTKHEKPLAFNCDTALGAPSTGLKLYDSAFLLRL